MISFELAQTLIVTATAVLAAGLIVRRTLGRKKAQTGMPGCPSCPVQVSRPDHPSTPSRG